MKITAIKQQVKNPNRASIFIDGAYSFSLALDEVVAQRLRSGLALDDSRLKELHKISEDGKIKARSMDWVMTRPRSIREFKDYLFRKQVDSALCERLVKDFMSKGYLDEDRFTAWLVELRQRSGKSNKAIEAELFKKGIGRSLMQRYVPNDELPRLRLVYEKKNRLTRYRKDPNKLKQYLLRQGFRYEDITTIMSQDK